MGNHASEPSGCPLPRSFDEAAHSRVDLMQPGQLFATPARQNASQAPTMRRLTKTNLVGSPPILERDLLAERVHDQRHVIGVALHDATGRGSLDARNWITRASASPRSTMDLRARSRHADEQPNICDTPSPETEPVAYRCETPPLALALAAQISRDTFPRKHPPWTGPVRPAKGTQETWGDRQHAHLANAARVSRSVR